jgi:phage/plasmid-like protein (TIGR03299 family)
MNDQHYDAASNRRRIIDVCGTRVNAEDSASALRQAGLDFRVTKQPLCVSRKLGKLRHEAIYRGRMPDDLHTLRDALCPSLEYFGIYRQDRMAEPLGIVGSRYAPIQHQDTFVDLADRTLDAARELGMTPIIDAGGIMQGGARVWLNLHLGSWEPITGDVHDLNIMVGTSHDGSGSYWIDPHSIRVFCANQVPGRYADSAKHGFRCRHTRGASGRIIEAHHTIANAIAAREDITRMIRMLSDRKVEREHIEAILDRLFPQTNADGKTTARARNQQAEVADLISDPVNRDVSANGEVTAYQVMNAVTDWVDHSRGARLSSARRAQGETLKHARAENALAGSGQSIKTAAIQSIIELTETCELRGVHHPDNPDGVLERLSGLVDGLKLSSSPPAQWPID